MVVRDHNVGGLISAAAVTADRAAGEHKEDDHPDEPEPWTLVKEKCCQVCSYKLLPAENHRYRSSPLEDKAKVSDVMCKSAVLLTNFNKL